eukprot:9170124-Alexandrium_andersonii.AAC.1
MLCDPQGFEALRDGGGHIADLLGQKRQRQRQGQIRQRQRQIHERQTCALAQVHQLEVGSREDRYSRGGRTKAGQQQNQQSRANVRDRERDRRGERIKKERESEGGCEASAKAHKLARA